MLEIRPQIKSLLTVMGAAKLIDKAPNPLLKAVLRNKSNKHTSKFNRNYLKLRNFMSRNMD